MTTVSAERLASIFVEVADTLVDEFDLLDFLHMLAERAADLVDAAAVGLLLTDERGKLQFMAGSNESVRLIELFQIQNQEGPCLDAFRTGEPVINVDLTNAGKRWPLFAPQATSAGFRAVHAFPMRLRNQVIGAMNVFGRVTGGGLTESETMVLRALTDVATISLLQERSIRRGELLTEQLQGALNSRIAIEQAKGAVAQLRGISVDEAFVVIRAYARAKNLRLAPLCQVIITDVTSLPELLRP